MNGLGALIGRNCKLFFKDKGMFFSSLITPAILLVLYATFLANVYKDSFTSAMPEGFDVGEKLIDATVGGQLIASLLAVSCVTVAFCSNFLMVQDKVNGVRKDLTVTPVKKSILALGYYIASFLCTMIITLATAVIGLIYLSAVGCYMTFADVLMMLADVVLLTLFGTALSSIINIFLTSQGQISAVGTIVSAGYGFICGAYMPISQFGDGLQKALSFLPGTYGTSLVKNSIMGGVFEEMGNAGIPGEVVEGIKKTMDCKLYFFDSQVDIPTMYIIMTVSVVLLIGVYIMLNVMRKGKK